MNLLAISCSIHGRLSMAEHLWTQLFSCAALAQQRFTKLRGAHLIQGSGGTPIPTPLIEKPASCALQFFCWGENKGFAKGMNAAFRYGIDHWKRYEGFKPDAVLLLNDDIEQDDPTWLDELLQHGDENRIVVPTTTFTKCREQIADRASYAPMRYIGMAPAIVWLIPRRAIDVLEARLGEAKLFSEQFGMAWGEDDYTAAILRKDTKESQPFVIAPLSWVRHVGQQTSNLIPEEDRLRSAKLAEEKIRALETEA